MKTVWFITNDDFTYIFSKHETAKEAKEKALEMVEGKSGKTLCVCKALFRYEQQKPKITKKPFNEK